MRRTRATLYLDADVLRATRIRAARTGKRDSEIVEEALREHLGFAAASRMRSGSDLDPSAAIRLAYQELHAMRRERRGGEKR